MQSFRFFDDPLFDSFWRHYDAQVRWMRSQGVEMVETPFRKPDDTSVPVDEETFADDEQDYDDVDDCEEDDCDISVEYLNFIAITRKHQQERDENKAEAKRREEKTVYRDICDVSGHMAISGDATSGSNSQSDLLKRLQRVQWYGEDDAEAIGRLEDEMDQKFEKLMKEHKPSFFPACPIVMNDFFDRKDNKSDDEFNE